MQKNAISKYFNVDSNSGEEERLLYMKSVNAVAGVEHTIDRTNLYEDVIDLYREGDVVGECPIKIEFLDELAVDHGGVQRDMYAAFWEKAYVSLFEGATLLTPMIHPQMDMSVLPVFGRILSHAYLVSGVLPIRIALPSLTCMLLGPTCSISKNVLLDTFLDFVSASERTTFKNALTYDTIKFFPSSLQEDLMSTLSLFGCRVLPTPSTLINLIQQVAQYEFLTKPAAGIALIHSGIPLNHRDFWANKMPSDIETLYQLLALSPKKVNSLFTFPIDMAMHQSRISGYLQTMVGNMSPEDLRLFMRFVTGSCACVTSHIKVSFNSLSGLARRPIAHTCGDTLELPTSYCNFDDFNNDFQAILSHTNEQFSWRMDAL